MVDVKTLRLASLQLTEELLERFLAYERCLLAALAEAAHHPDWAGRYAFSHARALAESGLDALTQQHLKAMVADFCGKRTAWLTVKERVAQAELRTASRQATAADEVLLSRARAELPRLEDLGDFEARYGAAALELLRSHELELVSLHQHLVRVEGSGGHLHPG